MVVKQGCEDRGDRALDLDGKVLGGRESPPVLRVGGWAIGCVVSHVLFGGFAAAAGMRR
jgi:hypothetical protein